MTDQQLNNLVIGILIALLFGSQIFWARFALSLVNRIMSRSYYEHQQAEAVTKPRVAPKGPEYLAPLDPIAEENARKANSLLGF